MERGLERATGSLADVADSWPAWAEVWQTLTFQGGHNTNVVVLGTTLLGFAAGIIGVFALLRKRSLMADALSHATLPGIGLFFLWAQSSGAAGRSLPFLLTGAVVSGVLGVLTIQALLRHTRLREDAAIGIVLSVYFGAGIVVLSYIQKNAAGSAGGLDRFIYGQTAAMSAGDAWLMGGIAAMAVVVALLFLKEFALVSFNEAFARVGGWPVALLDLLMMALVVLVTVSGLQAVGLILVVALLILPPVAARFWTERLRVLVILSGFLGALSGYLGSVVSALLPRKPAGAVIVLVAGGLFTASLIAAPARGVVAQFVRRGRLRLRIARDHVLEAGFERGRGAGPVGAAVLPRAELDALARLRSWAPGFRFLVFSSLRRRGEARIEGGDIVLTERGLREGARVHRNHRLWEQYLVSYADVAPSHVDWSVDQVEHVLSEDLVAELEHALASRGISVPAAAGGVSA